MRRPWMHKWLWILIGLVLLLCCLFGPLRGLFEPDVLVLGLEQVGSWAVVVFLGAHVVATVLGIPGTVLVVAGGTVFGLVWGTLLSVVGATLGAIAAFWTARCLLHDWIKRRFQHHLFLQRFNRMVHHNAFACVLAVRFAPIAPFNVVNFLFGLTPIPLKPYAVGTFIGIIPGTLAYTWLGVTGLQAFQGGAWWPFAIALCLLTLLSVMPLLARQRLSRC